MNALSDLHEIRNSLSAYAAEDQPIPCERVTPLLEKLSSLSMGLQTLGKTIQHTTDVSDALGLVVLMMDAAHDRKLDADQLRCLLEPLREKLGKAVEEMKLVV